ncbi:MAG TPA: hypothetical protein VGO80_06485 [Solirubrobacteraceae bacterium]|nr:hypothetical protein [Solirubrobacteraceae bacterium]
MRRRRREHTHRRGLRWLSEAARARTRLMALPTEGLDDGDLKLMVGHWRSALDDAAWCLAELRVLPVIRAPLLAAVRSHGPLSPATLANAGVRFAGRVLTAEEIDFLVADAVDAGLLVDCGEGLRAPRWRLAASGSRVASGRSRWRRR